MDKYKNDVSYQGSPEQLKEYAKKLEAGGMVGKYPSGNNYIVSYPSGHYSYYNLLIGASNKLNFKSHEMTEALEAALELAEPEVKLDNNGWMPIETAPKDGTEILVIDYNGINHVEYLFYKGEKRWCICGRSVQDKTRIIVPNPSHWQPLPKPPIV